MLRKQQETPDNQFNSLAMAFSHRFLDDVDASLSAVSEQPVDGLEDDTVRFHPFIPHTLLTPPSSAGPSRRSSYKSALLDQKPPRRESASVEMPLLIKLQRRNIRASTPLSPRDVSEGCVEETAMEIATTGSPAQSHHGELQRKEAQEASRLAPPSISSTGNQEAVTKSDYATSSERARLVYEI